MKKVNVILIGVCLLITGALSAQIDYSSHVVFCTGLNVPNEIVFDSAGNLFVANHSYASYSGPFSNTIAKIDALGNKSVFLSGYTWPSGLAIDNEQNLYMTQNNASSNITKITPGGSATTFASLPHSPGPVTLFDNNVSAQFAIYTVSHWGIKGVQKTIFNGSHSEFASGSFHGCQLSSDGQYLFVISGPTANQILRFNTATGISENWAGNVNNMNGWAGTIGPDNKLYIIGNSLCSTTKKAIFRVNGYNSVTEIVNNLPGTNEFNDLAFKQNGASWDLYVSEVAEGGRTDPASNRIIRFSDVFESGAIQITVDPCNNSLCAGDSATFTAFGLSSLPTGSLQWYVNGLPMSGINLNSGLKGYWPFDGNANDYSGNGNHAIQVTTTPTTDRHGNPNGAYNFAGLSNPQIIKVPNSPSLQFTNQASFSLWVNINSYYGMNGWGSATPYGVHMLFSKDFDQCCLYQAIAGQPDGNFNAGGCTNGWYSGINFGDTVPGSSIGQWIHMTYVFTPNEAKMYANAQLIASKTGTTSFTNANSKDLYFGRLNSFWYPLNGKLDDVRFYNRALSIEEVRALYYGYDTTFTYIPQNGDTVYCVYTSSGSPAVTDTSNFIIMQVNALPADIGESTGMGPLNGLVAWYPFNGNANDQSGNNNHGIYHGTLPTADPCGNAGMAAGFNGSSDWIEVPNSATLQSPTNAITIATWVKSTIPYIPFLCKINGPSYNVYQFRTLFNLNDHICTYGMNGQDFNSTMNSSPGMNNWFHYAVTYDGSLVKFYINGVADHEFSLTGGLLPNSERLEIGRDAHGPIEWLSGAMDDLRLYNRALTLPEIVSLQTGCQFLMVDCTNDSICEGSTANIRVIHSQPSIQYQLLQNGINFGPPQTGNGDTLNFPITGLTATSGFTIHALNPATGCNRMLDTTLTVTVVPFVPTTSPDTSVCSGNNAVLQAFGGTNYLWSNGMTGSPITVSPLATTTYYVTVTNAEECSGSDSVLVTILPGPQPTISGQASICLGTNNALYTTEPGMSNYTWTITGGSITAGAGTDSVTVTWNTLGIQSIGVNYANAQGCMAASPITLVVTVNPMAAPTIAGSTNHCVNSGLYTYTTEPGMNSYQWSVSPGGSIVWGNGTSSLIVTWDQPGAQWVAINYTNGSGCTALAPTQLSVTVNPLPGGAGTISGPSAVCAGSTGVNYSTAPIANAETYVWTLPPGATIVSGDGTNAITVDFSPSAQQGNIVVYGNNVCGNGTSSPAFPLSVSALPGFAGSPVGEVLVCEGDTGMIYYVTPIANASTYVWEIQGGGVITSGNGTNSIRVAFPVGPAACNLTVFGANSCGAGQISPALDITVNAIPDTPVITQNGDMLVSSAPDGNQWYFNGLLIAGATGQTHLPLNSGTYTVQVTLFGCVSDMSDGYYHIISSLTAPAMLQVALWPNPNTGIFRVSMSGTDGGPVVVSVINGLGVKVHEQSVNALSLNGSLLIEMGKVAPGIYLVMVEKDGLSRGLKMIVN